MARRSRGAKTSSSSPQLSTSKFNINNKNLIELYTFIKETITFQFLYTKSGDTVSSFANATMQMCNKTNLDSLRARDIQNILIQKYNFNVNEIKSILDKTELKAILANICTEKMSTIHSDIYFNYIVRFFIIVVFLQLLYLFRGLFYSILIYSVNPMYTFLYQLRLKSKMAKDCAKNSYVLALLSVVTSCLIDFLQQLMHIRVIVSWIFPSYSFVSILIRKLTPFVFSMPVNPQQLIGSRMPHVSLGGYGIDMGPIITIMIFNFIKQKCEEFAASKLIHITNKRNHKKHKKNDAVTRDGDVNELFGMDSGARSEYTNPYGNDPFRFDRGGANDDDFSYNESGSAGKEKFE